MLAVYVPPAPAVKPYEPITFPFCSTLTVPVALVIGIDPVEPAATP